jgi:hypothetical protein
MKKLLLAVFSIISFFNAFAQTPQYAVTGGTTANYIPFGAGSWSDQRCQFLYLPSEITPAAPVGFITKVYWRAGATQTGSTYNNFEVAICQNTATTLTTGPWQGPVTTVYTAPAEVINTTNGQWWSITLQTPFFYDPTLTLIIDTRQTSTVGAGFPILYASSTTNRRAYAASASPTCTAGAQRYDFGFDLIQGFPCTGAPTTTLVGPDQVCPNRNFNVSFGTFYTGVTRQWQKSTDGINWTNFTGTVNVNTGAITDAIMVNTYYRCIITCIATNQSYTAGPKLVKIAPFYYCYCLTTATASTGADIGNVTVNALPGNTTLLNNGTATPVENNPQATKGYTYFSETLPPVPMYKDSLYKFTVSQINSTTFANAVTAIYLDYNRNGTFDDSERILKAPSVNVLPNPGVVTGTYKLHDSSKYGLTGMRVVLKVGTADPDTCGNYPNGETEDYLVDLRFVPCDGKPAPGTIQGDTSMCEGYKYILTDTTYQKYKHGIDRFWQLSADAVNWVDIPGSMNKDTLTRIFSGQPLYYRVMATCSHTNDTDYTAPHKVNIKPGYKCYCFSQSTNTSEDTSDIGSFKLARFEQSTGSTHLLNPLAFKERTDYTDLPPIEIDVDSVYQFYVFHTMPYQNHADAKVTVFVDFNNNKQYDIPEERIYTGFTSIGNHVKIGNLIIPNNVIVNMPTGMRVIVNNDVAPNIPSDEACGTYISGETEDYIVFFSRPFGVGVKDADGIDQLSLSPNPTTGKFQLQFKGAASQEGVTVKVMSVTGQVVKQEVYPHNGGIFRQVVDISNQAKGVYMVEVSSAGQKMTQKLTVQ